MSKPIRRYLLFVLVFFLIAGGITILYFYKKNISYNNPNLASESRARSIAEQVGKLVALPTDEVPTVATVSDPALLKDQGFFAEAKKGDIVLIYTGAGKAILYDPVINKIINMSSINLGNNKSSTQTLPSFQGGELKLQDTGKPGEF